MGKSILKLSGELPDELCPSLLGRKKISRWAMKQKLLTGPKCAVSFMSLHPSALNVAQGSSDPLGG